LSKSRSKVKTLGPLFKFKKKSLKDFENSTWAWYLFRSLFVGALIPGAPKMGQKKPKMGDPKWVKKNPKWA